MAHKSSYQNIGELYVPILFRWEGGGHELHLCTSFTGWEANKIPMTRSQRAIGYSHSTETDTSHSEFTVVVELPEGVHEYKYFVDGEWTHDPNAETMNNAFGTLNNVRRVTKEDFKSAQLLQSVPPKTIPEEHPPSSPPMIPPPSQPVSKQPPPSKPVSKQPPPSKPVSKQPPPSKTVSKQPPPSKPVSKQPPPSKPVTKQPPPSKPVTKQPPPSKPAPPAQAVPKQPVVKVRVGATVITEELGHGTIQPAANFDPEADAVALRKATKKLGTDEKTVIDILAHRSNDQRQAISSKFNVMYSRDLITEFKSDLSFNFKNTVLALMVPRTLYDAQCLNKAIKGGGTDEKCLVEILCSRTNAEIHAIKQVYKAEFGHNLEKDVADDTSGHFKRLMVSLCQGAREESSRVDMAKAQREAQELYKAGEKKWGTDEANFIPILTLRSFPQLRVTFDKYSEIAKRDILESIGQEMSGDLRTGMKAIVRCARSRHHFFSDRLYKIMKGAGTNDATLIRIIVSRSEVDLVEIKKVFLESHKKTLSKAIEGDTSGDYRRLLLAIVGNHD